MGTLRRALGCATVICLLAALPAGAAPAVSDCLRTVAGVDLQTVTIPELQTAMDDGRLTSAQLVDAYLARIAAYDADGPKLDSVRELNQQARAQAAALDAERAAGNVRGPLHGIPILLKDNVATADMPTTGGAKVLEGAIPNRDATITRKLRDAGAVILGKANLSEFAGWVDLNAPPGWSSLGGQVRNAYNLSSTPSGSSAGSGVAASMALAAATIGTETSGSILSPSDANSDVGVKTTLGLASRAGILPLSPGFDVPGPIVRNVTDAAAVLAAIAGPDPDDSATAGSKPSDYLRALRPGALEGARLAYSQDAYDGLSATRRQLFDAGIARLERLGTTVVGVQSMTAQYAGIAEIGLIPNEFKASLNAFLADYEPTAAAHSLDDIVAYAQAHPDDYPHGYSLLQGSNLTPGQAALYPAAEAVRRAAGGIIEAALAEATADAIITPGNVHANIGAAAGYPTVIEPLGYTNNGRAPMGIGFLGRPYSEAKLLAYAYDYEQDAKARVPPTDVNPQLTTPACGA